MRIEGEKSPFTEDDVVARLDRAAGAPLVRERLFGRGRAPLAAIYRELGIEPIGPDKVRLHDDAPLASLRKSIF
jgi:hypothetical protein